MDDYTPHKPRSRGLDTRMQVRAIDDWIAQERKLISTREKMKRRFMREIISAMGIRETEAESLFEMLVQTRQAQAVSEKAVRSAREYFHPGRNENLHRLRATYARWAIDTGETASCVSDRPDTADASANRECPSYRFGVDGSRHRVVVPSPGRDDGD